MKKLIAILLVLPFMGVSFVSCSDDDDVLDSESGEELIEVIEADELDYLQNTLVKVDSLGGLESRIYGVPLDPADTTVVSVGVDNLDEAKSIFAGFFADTTEISNNGMHASFVTREGEVDLVEALGEDGLIAYVTFNLPELKYVSRINFILNSAWPENASDPGYYKIGMMEDLPFSYSYGIGNIKYVCIREYENGKPAILLGISNFSLDFYRLRTVFGGYSKRIWGNYGMDMCYDMIKELNKSRQNLSEISFILNSEWERYKSYFNYYGECCLDENRNYRVGLNYNDPCCYSLKTGEAIKDDNMRDYELRNVKGYLVFYKEVGATK